MPTRGCRVMKKILISDLIAFIYLITYSQLHGICRTEQKGKQRTIHTTCHGAVWSYLTLLWYHGVNVTPVLFDSSFFLNCHEY